LAASRIHDRLASLLTAAPVALLLSLPVVMAMSGWDTWKLMTTHNCFKGISVALHEYHDEYGCFPPVVVRGEDGRAEHSWRSLIHPYRVRAVYPRDEGGPPDDRVYRFSAVWDSPHNLEVGRWKGGTNPAYDLLAVVGPGTVWEEGGTCRWKDVTDRTSNTLLAIAVPSVGIGWHEPRDAVFDGESVWGEVDGVQKSLAGIPCFLLLTDGNIRYVDGLSEASLAALVTIDAGDDPGSFW